MKLFPILGVFLSFVLTLRSQAAVTVTPESPTSNDVLTATIDREGGCNASSSTVVTGTLVRTTIELSGCFPGPPPFTVPEVVQFGPLPAGTYTYEVYFHYENEEPQLEAQLTLVVAEAPAPAAIPTIDRVARLLLFAALGIAGIVALRRAV